MLMGWVTWVLEVGGLFAAGALFLPRLMKFLTAHKVTDTNYHGDSIPTASGLLLLLVLLCGYFVYRLVPSVPIHVSTEYMLSLTLVGAAGLLDDLIGDKQIKGIENHWRAWRHGSASTGVVKAAVVGTASLLLFAGSGEVSGMGKLLLATGLSLLMSNGMNLLDVRPGRALKGYFLLWVPLVVGNDGKLFLGGEVLLLIGAGLLAYPDLRGKLMLGDTGAGMLGFALGASYIAYTPVYLQLVVLGVVAALHGLTWRRSLSRIIESHRWLQRLDEFGRGRIGER
ncbi:hypothetical protein [Paenibacillus cremeus]|nr:hypothetical protein [Paenibacillus cremeus]